MLVGRRQDKLDALATDICAAYPSSKIHNVAISVTDYDAVATLPRTLPDEFQAVEVLVNNAGLALGVNPVDKNSVSDSKEVIDTNVMGVVAFCSAFVPGMIERKAGHIINMGSVAVGYHRYARPFIFYLIELHVPTFLSIYIC